MPEETEPATLEAAAILEGDISPEDALAFFARLSAGKEDQLRAEAEAEGESRMATIMGRPSTAPLVAETPVEPAQPIEQDSVVETAPDWLSQLSAVAAATPTEPIEEAPTEESSDWLSRLSATIEAAPTPPDELPEWLRAMRPSDEAIEVEGAEPPAEIEATPGEELPGWLRSMQPAAAPSTEEEPTFEIVTDESASLEVNASEVADIELTPATELPAWLSDLQPSACSC